MPASAWQLHMSQGFCEEEGVTVSFRGPFCSPEPTLVAKESMLVLQKGGLRVAIW